MDRYFKKKIRKFTIAPPYDLLQRDEYEVISFEVKEWASSFRMSTYLVTKWFKYVLGSS